MKPANLRNPPKKKRSKMNAKRVRHDDISFQSIKEGNYYLMLRNLQRAGAISHFFRQVIFDLGGGTTYRLDFLVFYNDGTVRYIDVKGFRTPVYIKNKKQAEALYPIEIEEV